MNRHKLSICRHFTNSRAVPICTSWPYARWWRIPNPLWSDSLSLSTHSHVSAEYLFFNSAMPPLRLRFASSQCRGIRRMLKMEIRFLHAGMTHPIFILSAWLFLTRKKSWNPSDFHPINSPLTISLFLFYFLFPVAVLLLRFSGSGLHPVLQFRIPAFLFLPAVIQYRQLFFCKNLRIFCT